MVTPLSYSGINLSILVNKYAFLRAASIPALVRLCNNYNLKMGVAYKFDFQDGNDGYFYAIYYGKIETKIDKPTKTEAVEINPKEIIDA